MSRVRTHRPHRPRRGTRTHARALLSDIAIGLLSLLVLVCVGLAAPALWTVIVKSTTPQPRACDSIKSPVERATCARAAVRQ